MTADQYPFPETMFNPQSRCQCLLICFEINRTVWI